MSETFNEFCRVCGAILPLPLSTDASPEVKCRLCGYRIDVEHFNGITATTRIVFNSRSLITKKSDKNSATAESEGPVIERKCSKCGNNRQTYATLQTRSADEGQTVFYTCLNCGAQENENS